jgi:hypothetical protein
MKKLTHKQLVEMAVKIIYTHSHCEENPITMISKEECGDHLLHVHKSAFPEVYRTVDALRLVAVIHETSRFNEDYFRIAII